LDFLTVSLFRLTLCSPEIASLGFTGGNPSTIGSSGFAGSDDLPLRLHLSLLGSFSQTPDLSLSHLLDFLAVSLFRLTLCSS
jgi:hypothetical protein